MPTTVRGTFEVTIIPVTTGPAEHAPGISLATLTKTYEGPLSGKALGHMVSTMSDTPGSAGYVALEKVDGALDGRKGSFALQHNGLMNRGDGTLTVVVVPDSGTDGLTGLAGSLDIEVGDGHRYVFTYSLPAIVA